MINSLPSPSQQQLGIFPPIQPPPQSPASQPMPGQDPFSSPAPDSFSTTKDAPPSGMPAGMPGMSPTQNAMPAPPPGPPGMPGANGKLPEVTVIGPNPGQNNGSYSWKAIAAYGIALLAAVGAIWKFWPKGGKKA